jgi:hypothetical protein
MRPIGRASPFTDRPRARIGELRAAGPRDHDMHLVAERLSLLDDATVVKNNDLHPVSLSAHGFGIP